MANDLNILIVTRIMIWSIVAQVISIFGSAVLSAYAICLINSVPFYNPVLSKVQLVSSLYDSVKNLSIIGLEVIVCAYLYYPYLDNRFHSFLRTTSNIIEYSMWIELFYYSYHRLLHTSNFYSIIHAQHHKNRVVYPMDTLTIHWLDSTGMIFTLITPIWFVQVDNFEHNFIMYLYLTGAFLSHSKILSRRHVIHHEKFKCNYCFLFPVFDYAFGTMVEDTIFEEEKTD
jgi:sterol desaturase/sphingolipid hydroxylase (fatty acid hydroxylase superfamily)